jgi:hypothetical protein
MNRQELHVIEPNKDTNHYWARQDFTPIENRHGISKNNDFEAIGNGTRIFSLRLRWKPGRNPCIRLDTSSVRLEDGQRREGVGSC